MFRFACGCSSDELCRGSIIHMVRTENIYELRLFDRPLLLFSFGSEVPVRLLEWDDRALPLMPAGLTLTDEGLWKWLSSRAIPQNRKFATELCRTLGLSVNDRSGILEISYGLSLNDSYWIVPEGFTGSFEQHNLFENGFSLVLAAVAYTGVISDMHGLTPSTPELTTNGNLRKAWRIADNGDRVLYKGASGTCAEYGEARVEYLASQVACALGLNAVEYGLSQWGETLDGSNGLDNSTSDVCSTCKCFCSPEISYMPQALAFDQSSHTQAVKTYLAWESDYFESYASMMVFDALIYNTDRHLTNFGILRDSRSGEYLGCAPLFDNRRSLFFNLHFDQVDDFAIETQFVLPSWAQVTFDEQAGRLIGPIQKEQLLRLAHFEFANCPEHPFPEVFLSKLSAFIRRRAEELVELPTVSRDKLKEAAGDALDQPGA